MGVTEQRRASATSLLLIALVLVAAVMVSNAALKGWRFDLTENGLYTLSDGTKRLLGDIDEPINIYFYYSDKATEGIPQLRGYANRVREMLEEFAAASGGKVRLSVIDPLPFSEDEDRAAQFGLQAVSIASVVDPVYFGLAGTNSVGDEETIAFFQPGKENFLEYDLARLVSTLAASGERVVGLLSGADMGAGFDPQTQQMTPAWAIDSQARQLFDVRNLNSDIDRIDEDVSVLWVVQPKNLSLKTQYAIDQFILGGGKALIFVDPLAEVDAPPPNPQMPQMPQPGQGSNLNTLFDAWGIEFPADEVVTDARLGLQISGPGGRPARHPGILGIDDQNLNAEDVVTADLTNVNVSTSGHLVLSEDSIATLTPLLTSSMSAMTQPASRFTFLPDPSSLLDGFAPSGDRYVIAARIGGQLPSAFPDGAPPAAIDLEQTDPVDPERESSENSPTHIAVASDSVNVIVVADVDTLSDRLWVQSQNFFGQRIATAFADNGNFVMNALENLMGSANLISVRSRSTFARPFSRVEDLRTEAEALFRRTEQQLQSELSETERKLSDLQATRDDSGTLLLSSEQEAEIQRFIDQRARIRKDLRAVQRDLDKNIEQLGTTLKAINIGLVPLLLTVFGIFALWRKNRRPGT